MSPSGSDEALLRRADSFAEKIFAGQTRKGRIKKPKIEHMREVAELLRGAGCEAREQVAGLFHDAVEEKAVEPEILKLEVGWFIFDIIAEVTDSPEMKRLPTHAKKAMQAERTRKSSPRAKRVKLADQISNIRETVSNPPEDWDDDRCRDYIFGARDVAEAARDASPELYTLFMLEYRAAEEKYGMF